MVAQGVNLNLPCKLLELLVTFQDMLLHQSFTIMSQSITCTLALDVFWYFPSAWGWSRPMLVHVSLSASWDFDFLDRALWHILFPCVSGAEDLVLFLTQGRFLVKAKDLPAFIEFSLLVSQSRLDFSASSQAIHSFYPSALFGLWADLLCLLSYPQAHDFHKPS